MIPEFYHDSIIINQSARDPENHRGRARSVNLSNPGGPVIGTAEDSARAIEQGVVLRSTSQRMTADA
jgi:hypothetical protein